MEIGEAAGPGNRRPTRGVLPDGGCASAANGAASTAPRPATKARRSIPRTSGWRDASVQLIGAQGRDGRWSTVSSKIPIVASMPPSFANHRDGWIYEATYDGWGMLRLPRP